MLYIAIDPGASGAIVWQEDNGNVEASNMPKTLRDIWNLLYKLGTTPGNVSCLIEKVGTYMPGNSGPSAAMFAEHVGTLKMSLIGCMIPHEFMTPTKWQELFVGKGVRPKLPKLPDLPKHDESYKIVKTARSRLLSKYKIDRKNLIKSKAQEVYPHIQVTLLNADALGMLWVLTKRSS